MQVPLHVLLSQRSSHTGQLKQDWPAKRKNGRAEQHMFAGAIILCKVATHLPRCERSWFWLEWLAETCMGAARVWQILPGHWLHYLHFWHFKQIANRPACMPLVSTSSLEWKFSHALSFGFKRFVKKTRRGNGHAPQSKNR